MKNDESEKSIFVITCTPEDGDKGSAGSLTVEASNLDEAIENNKSALKSYLIDKGHASENIKYFSGFSPKNPEAYKVGEFHYHEGDCRL